MPQSASEFSLGQFSLHRLVLAAAQRRAVPIRELGTAEDSLKPVQDGVFDASVKAMQYWCRLNENLVLERHAKDARLLVGFERLSRVRPVAKRYRRLAASVAQLTLFAECDDVLNFEARTVDVAGSPLAREWFLVIDAPAYKTLLVARDKHGFGPTGPLVGRRFAGLITHNAELVETAVDALARVA